MLGSDKSRGYCLEMIAPTSSPGAHLGQWQPRDPAQLNLALLQFPARSTKACFL